MPTIADYRQIYIFCDIISLIWYMYILNKLKISHNTKDSK